MTTKTPKDLLLPRAGDLNDLEDVKRAIEKLGEAIAQQNRMIHGDLSDLNNSQLPAVQSALDELASNAVTLDGAQTVSGAKTLSASLAMSNQKITGLANGTAGGDALHAGQVDNATIEAADGVLQLKDGGIPNAKIAPDAAISLTKLASGAARIEIGSYAGNANTSQAIEIGFRAGFLFVCDDAEAYNPAYGYFLFDGAPGAKSISNADYYANLELTATGFIAKTVSSNDLNNASRTYYYLALKVL